MSGAARFAQGTRVVIAGGGLAGLAAALECADRGARVTLLERRRHLGGLTSSFDHGGLTFDNGQHVFLACCDHYLRFLARIGSASDVEGPRALDIPVVAPGTAAAVVGRLRRRNLPVPLHLAAALMRYPHLTAAARVGLGRALVGLARLDPADPAADRTSFADWLAAHGQSPAAIAGLWDLITVPTVNLPAAEASLAVAAMVMRTALLSRAGAADIGWSRVPLGRLHGQAAVRTLHRLGVDIRLGVRVGAVAADPGGGWAVATSDGPLDADAVVVALPHEEASAVVPAAAAPTQARWPELGSSAVIDVHLVFDRPVSPWEVFAAHRSPLQWVFDRTEASGLAAAAPGHQYLAASFSAADALVPVRPEELVTSTVAALGRLLPGVGAARLVDSLVTKERRATFAARPGTASARPAPATAYAGLVLAGAWTATGWPATMEGAVRSGMAAAAHLSASSAAAEIPTPQEVA